MTLIPTYDQLLQRIYFYAEIAQFPWERAFYDKIIIL